MMTWLEMVAHYKGYQNLLHESTPFRFPLMVRSPRPSLYQKVLRGLGRRLVHWGQALQGQSPAPVSSSWEARRTG